MNEITRLPELLAPAGSPEALDAAIAAGADAVYFGGGAFNARMNAQNFVGETLEEAIKKCRLYGVKSNITLNTLVNDREMRDVLSYVERLYTLGADALIVADLGTASLIKRHFPDIELHASTQALGHNTDAAKVLADLGFSRMVAARELSRDALAELCKNSPIETEMFIHGAICVSQSGGCLASSLIGGRSGNRGECAQPCRLPYKCAKNNKETYALSLKDMCLAEHIPEILELGVASLKIEGRMKSPDYVYGVTSIYRRLLDERRSATMDELSELRALFSRSGFTDGYFKKKIGREMLGIRTDADKADTSQKTAKTVDYGELLKARRRKIDMSAKISADKPSLLTVRLGEHSVTAVGTVPDMAQNCPLSKEAVQKNLTKLGSSPFSLGELTIELDGGLIMPVSALNALRREAVDKLTEKLTAPKTGALPITLDKPEKREQKPLVSARFTAYERIPDNVGECEIVYLPLEKFREGMQDKVNGVIIPPVVFDAEMQTVRDMLKLAANSGVKHALVSNLGHITLAKEAGLTLHGDFRLNVFNSYTADVLCSLGFEDIIASPELTLPQLRDLSLPPIIYGRVPLMTLEKCVIRDLYSCEECKKREFFELRDRKGISFPLSRAFEHRNIMYNSVPVFMADKKDELIKYRIVGAHYIFTDESAQFAEAMLGESTGVAPIGGVRRISK